MSLTTQQRRSQIAAQVLEKGHVTAKSLADSLGVSEATVRRDLRALSDAQQVELVYGGATVPRPSDFSFRSKATRNVEAKRTIGQLAADLVADGDQLLIDSGTTCLEMAPHLKRKRGLSVVVNSVRLAGELAGAPEMSLILIGGHYRADRMDTIGPLAEAALGQLRGYVAFIGADGLSMEFGVSASDIESAHLYNLAIRNARESILLVDQTKFRCPSLCKIVEWDAISRVVTDVAPAPEWMAFLDAKGIAVIYPGAMPNADGNGTPPTQ